MAYSMPLIIIIINAMYKNNKMHWDTLRNIHLKARKAKQRNYKPVQEYSNNKNL